VRIRSDIVVSLPSCHGESSLTSTNNSSKRLQLQTPGAGTVSERFAPLVRRWGSASLATDASRKTSEREIEFAVPPLDLPYALHAGL